jgi:hypothetical protein
MRAFVFAILGIPVVLSAQQQTLQPMSANALEQILAAKNTSDADMAKQLSVVELTERVPLRPVFEPRRRARGNEVWHLVTHAPDKSDPYYVADPRP